MNLDFRLNGREVSITTDPGRRVIDVLREEFGLTGVKEACSSGECGACSIIADGETRLACLMLACQLQGREITTVEGLSVETGHLHKLQQSFVERGAVQCGYCSPGMLMAGVDLLTRNQWPTRQEIREGISGNLCRCTGYHKIVDAIEAASKISSEAERQGLSWENPDAVVNAVSDPLSQHGDTGLPLSLTGQPGITAACEIYQPRNLEELLQQRESFPDALLMAGGTDLLVWLREGRIKGRRIILTEKIEGFQAIEPDGDRLRIGSGASIQNIIDHPVVQAEWPLLVLTLRKLASPPIRHMASLAGNVCSASPAGDSLPALYVLGATVELAGIQRTRMLPVAEFITGPGRTAITRDECLVSIHMPRPEPGLKYGFIKLGQRQSLAIAIASLAYQYRLNDEGIIEKIALAWGSVGSTVMRFPMMEEELKGQRLERSLLDKIAPKIEAMVQPIDDIRASAAYRRTMAGRLLYYMLD